MSTFSKGDRVLVSGAEYVVLAVQGNNAAVRPVDGSSVSVVKLVSLSRPQHDTGATPDTQHRTEFL